MDIDSKEFSSVSIYTDNEESSDRILRNPEQPEFRQAKTNDRLEQATEKSLAQDSIDHDLSDSSFNQAFTDRSEIEAILLQSYQRHRQAAEKKSHLVLVTGPSGAGKTMLVRSLQKHVTSDKGYFLTGKFDQLQRREPYLAFCAAFMEFAAAVVAKGEDSVSEMRSAIQSAIGDETAVLKRMIPALELILGQKDCQTSDTAVKANDAMQRFLFVFRMFLRAVCSPEHPIVLVLDDLQWAEPCSVDILLSIVIDTSNDGLIVIATCDSNDSPDSYMAAKLRE
jgi:predicted ATPase